MAIDSLKKCPFCGGEGMIKCEGYSFPLRYYPLCQNDKCILANIREDEDGRVSVSYPTPEEAAAAWDTRSEEDQQRLEIERLREELQTEKERTANNHLDRLAPWYRMGIGRNECETK